MNSTPASQADADTDAAEAAQWTDRLAEVVAEIAKLTAEKKQLEAKLEAYGLKHPELHASLKDEKREGRRMTLRGARHHIPLVFTSDLLIGSFKQDSPKHKQLLAILAKDDSLAPLASLLRFFDAPTSWERRIDDGQKFRAAVAEWLPAGVAAEFITACTQADKHGVKKSNVAFDYKAATRADGKAES